MPNQWSPDASNPLNPIDGVGYCYSNIIGTFAGNSLDKLYPTSGFTMEDFWRDFPFSEIDSLKYDLNNLYKNALDNYSYKTSRKLQSIK